VFNSSPASDKKVVGVFVRFRAPLSIAFKVKQAESNSKAEDYYVKKRRFTFSIAKNILELQFQIL
jgi:hypothetical protein